VINKKNILLLSILIYIGIQLFYVSFLSLPFRSDSLMFYNFAQQSLAIGKFYPNMAMINADYLVSPVFVNYNFILLNLFNSPYIILYFNILLNTIQLLLIYKITQKLFGSKNAVFAAIIYMIYLTNLGLVLANLSELLFGVLIFSSIYFYLSRNTFFNFILCGLFAGIALGVRPIAAAVILAYLLIYFYELYRRNKPDYRKIIFIISGVLVYILVMGSISKKNIGHFVFTAGTGAINLALSTNDSSTGVYSESIFKNDSIYNSKTTFTEKNDYLVNKSLIWIKHHPFKFFTTIPRKIYSTFISDDWVVSQLAHTNNWEFNKFIKATKNPVLWQEFKKEPFRFRLIFIIINFLHQLIYLSIVGLIVYQFYYFIKNKLIDNNIILLYLIFLMGYSMTFIASVGTPRYKYPLILIGIILISPAVNHIYHSIFKKSTSV
jgi:hypothetical protein